MYDIFQIMTFFMFYAVLGWCVEVIYKTTCTGRFVNRGFLNGPLCPIYGFGATAVIVCLTPLNDNLAVLYIGSVVLTSALEFVTGLVLEKLFHQKWWDYTDEHFNIKGYVCLRFSLAWGLACVFVMRIVQPPVLALYDRMPIVLRNVIFIAFYGLLAADLTITVAALAKVGRSLKLANDLDRFLNGIAEAVGRRLSDGTIKGMAEIEERREKLDELKAKGNEYVEERREKLDELKAKGNEYVEERREKLDELKIRNSEKMRQLQQRYEAASARAKLKYGEHATGHEGLNFVHRRLEKAYPGLDFKRIGHEELEAKLQSLKDGFDEFAENIGNMKL